MLGTLRGIEQSVSELTHYGLLSCSPPGFDTLELLLAGKGSFPVTSCAASQCSSSALVCPCCTRRCVACHPLEVCIDAALFHVGL